MTPARVYAPQLVALAVSAVVLAWLFHATRLDLRLATPWYDPAQHTFPWRYAWITKYFIHRYLKVLHISGGIAMWMLALRASKTQSGFFATHRRRVWCVAVSFVAVPVTIAVLHRLSAMHCPWEVADFGGTAPYFDLLSPAPVGIRAGHCFPAAFVSSGSWMLAFAWLAYPERPRLGAAIGIAAFAWAFGLGWVQQMRGAHFLSHTLWSLWVSWAVVLFVHFACGAWREQSETDSAALTLR